MTKQRKRISHISESRLWKDTLTPERSLPHGGMTTHTHIIATVFGSPAEIDLLAYDVRDEGLERRICPFLHSSRRGRRACLRRFLQ